MNLNCMQSAESNACFCAADSGLNRKAQAGFIYDKSRNVGRERSELVIYEKPDEKPDGSSNTGV